MSRDRQIHLQKFFECELPSWPLAIVNSDGSLAKTKKAKTFADLEETGQSIHDPESFRNVINSESQRVAIFIDHMACIRRMISRVDIKTFGDMSDALQETIQSAFRLSDTIQVISDRYRYDINGSIKAGERMRRD